MPHLVLAMVALCVTLFLFPQLPDRIPLQWSFTGEVNRYGGRNTALLLPGVMLITVFIAWFVPQIDPRAENYRRFGASYAQLMLALQLLLSVVQGLLLLESLRPGNIDIAMAIFVGIGIFLAIFGNLMPKLKHNYFTGVRTPWTLSDEENWYATHRVTGPVWFTGGLLLIAAAFMPEPLKQILFACVLVVIAMFPWGYSFFFFLRKKNQP